jgi:hypothetical protein
MLLVILLNVLTQGVIMIVVVMLCVVTSGVI